MSSKNQGQKKNLNKVQQGLQLYNRAFVQDEPEDEWDINIWISENKREPQCAAEQWHLRLKSKQGV